MTKSYPEPDDWRPSSTFDTKFTANIDGDRIVNDTWNTSINLNNSFEILHL